jgi:hypothetical protein
MTLDRYGHLLSDDPTALQMRQARPSKALRYHCAIPKLIQLR